MSFELALIIMYGGLIALGIEITKMIFPKVWNWYVKTLCKINEQLNESER